MALSGTKKVLLVTGGLLALTVGLSATGVYMLIGEVEIPYTQDPNRVEEHEANRKLNLFNEAQSAHRKGFVRLSEVEINSFILSRYNDTVRANDRVRLLKTGVLLSATNLTFVTWHEAPIWKFNVPFLWQRVVTPRESTNGWSFELEKMQLGKIEVPEQFWPKVDEIFGSTDEIFQERKVWLANVPQISLARNEMSKIPELRLYTYVPQDKNLK